jgi:GntR family transcriptional repressor for pyruvate dehydrogenase complex
MSKRQLFSKPVHKQTLAQRLATEIENMILSNELVSGANLPSEIDLAQQYGVSRSVARDATRILMAKGLVEVQHGRGVFVSDPGNNAFVDGLLITLRRNRVNSWEIRQLALQLYPQVVTLTLENATEGDLSTIKNLGLSYLETFLSFHSRWEEESFIPELEQSQIRIMLLDQYRAFLEALLNACHNKALKLLVTPILIIHTTPAVEENQVFSPPPHFGADVHIFRQFILALETHDLTQALELLENLMSTSTENIEKLKKTPLEGFPFINQLL